MGNTYINPAQTQILHENDIAEFTFTGTVRRLTLTTPGIYFFQAWGAQGGNQGGLGALVTARLLVESPITIEIFVGGQGGIPAGGWNGGGPGGTQSAAGTAGGGGGGATDIRIGGVTLSHRVLVAGAGAGRAGPRSASWNSPPVQGNGPAPGNGGLNGTNGTSGVNTTVDRPTNFTGTPNWLIGSTYTIFALGGERATQEAAGPGGNVSATVTLTSNFTGAGGGSSGSGGGGGGGYFGGGGGAGSPVVLWGSPDVITRHATAGGPGQLGIGGPGGVGASMNTGHNCYAGASGGGGSSIVLSPMTNASYQNGVRSGDGLLRITMQEDYSENLLSIDNDRVGWRKTDRFDLSVSHKYLRRVGDVVIWDELPDEIGNFLCKVGPTVGWRDKDLRPPFNMLFEGVTVTMSRSETFQITSNDFTISYTAMFIGTFAVYNTSINGIHSINGGNPNIGNAPSIHSNPNGGTTYTIRVQNANGSNLVIGAIGSRQDRWVVNNAINKTHIDRNITIQVAGVITLNVQNTFGTIRARLLNSSGAEIMNTLTSQSVNVQPETYIIRVISDNPLSVASGNIRISQSFTFVAWLWDNAIDLMSIHGSIFNLKTVSGITEMNKEIIPVHASTTRAYRFFIESIFGDPIIYLFDTMANALAARNLTHNQIINSAGHLMNGVNLPAVNLPAGTYRYILAGALNATTASYDIRYEVTIL